MAEDLRPLRVKRMSWEAPGVLALDLMTPDGAALPAWAPGAHLDLQMPGVPLRQYSLCGDPAERSLWRIAVREIAGGRTSGFVHRALRPGALIEAGGPRNNFPLASAPRYLFIAGGIGITPLLPMLRAATQAGAAWTLLFCVRHAGEAPFLKEARALGGTVVLHAADPGARLDVATRLATPEPETMLYCCGPERLMLAVEAATTAWPEGCVRFEWFAPRSRDDAGGGSFEVRAARSGLSLTVQPGTSVLEALRAAGIALPSSCEQGVCGSCECAVLEGEVEHHDSILSSAERAANRAMMVCVSRAKGARLVLDV
jgi:ferredoxin-NADP reductase